MSAISPGPRSLILTRKLNVNPAKLKLGGGFNLCTFLLLTSPITELRVAWRVWRRNERLKGTLEFHSGEFFRITVHRLGGHFLEGFPRLPTYASGKACSTQVLRARERGWHAWLEELVWVWESVASALEVAFMFWWLASQLSRWQTRLKSFRFLGSKQRLYLRCQSLRMLSFPLHINGQTFTFSTPLLQHQKVKMALDCSVLVRCSSYIKWSSQRKKWTEVVFCTKCVPSSLHLWALPLVGNWQW